MMKNSTVLLLLAASALLVGSSARANVYIDDGVSHTIEDSTYQAEKIVLDAIVANNPGTHVDVLEGALLYGVDTYNNATVTMNGGSVSHDLSANGTSSMTIWGGEVVGKLNASANATVAFSGGSAYDIVSMGSSIVIINGGSVGHDVKTEAGGNIYISNCAIGNNVMAQNGSITVDSGTTGWGLYALNGKVTMYGGSLVDDLRATGGVGTTAVVTGGVIGDDLSAQLSGIITMSGGTVGGDIWTLWNGTIYLEGTDFAVDGQPIPLGSSLSDYGTLVVNRPSGQIKDYYTGRLTGVLSDGSELDNIFRISNIGVYAGTGDIIVIPEPATCLLVGLGGLGLLPRRRA